MLKEDLDSMQYRAKEIIDMIIDNIVFGPAISDEQVMALWTIISEKANTMSKE